MEDKMTVRAVERALDVLLCFADATDLSLTEISVRVGLHKSTVHRLLATLESKGFLVRDPVTDKYKVGLRVWELSMNVANTDDPAIALLPEMEKLRDALGETISLYIRDGVERVRIQAVQSNEAIRRVAPIGARLPLFVGASSKVLLAFSPDDVRNQTIASMEFPPGMDKRLFHKQLDEIRQAGYATSIEEREAGAAAVSAPIYHSSGRLAAALSVSGPSNRLTLEVMRAQAPAIMAAAQRMGRMLR